jgi:hypothetical protein
MRGLLSLGANMKRRNFITFLGWLIDGYPGMSVYLGWAN